MAHLVRDADGHDEVFQLGPSTSVGRHPDNDVQVLDRLVSKQHCRVERRNDQWLLVDLGTLNGSFVNEIRVQGETALRHRDIIRVGETHLWFSDLERALAFPKRKVVSAEARTAVAAPNTDRAALVRTELEALLGVLALDDLPRQALAGASVLAQADGAIVLDPERLVVQHWSGRGREILERDYFRELADRVRAERAVVWQTHTRDLAYRVWQPRCTLMVPVAHGGRTFALIAVESDGSDPIEPADLQLYARVVGAVWAALSAL